MLKEKRKRRRVPLSCLNCKKRKVRCDKSRPCAGCVSNNVGHLCVYVEPEWVQTPGQTAELQARLDAQADELERVRAQAAELEAQLAAKDLKPAFGPARSSHGSAASDADHPPRHSVPPGDQFTALTVLRLPQSKKRIDNDGFYTMHGFHVTPRPYGADMYSWPAVVRADPHLTALWRRILSLQRSYHRYKTLLKQPAACGHHRCPVVACELLVALEKTPSTLSAEPQPGTAKPASKAPPAAHPESAVDVLTALRRFWAEITACGWNTEQLSAGQLAFLVEHYFAPAAHGPEPPPLLGLFKSDLLALFLQDGANARLDVGPIAPQLLDSAVVHFLEGKTVFLAMLALVVDEALDALHGAPDPETRRRFQAMFPLELAPAPSKGSDLLYLVVSHTQYLLKAPNTSWKSLLAFLALVVAVLNRLTALYDSDDTQMNVTEAFLDIMEPFLVLMKDFSFSLRTAADPVKAESPDPGIENTYLLPPQLPDGAKCPVGFGAGAEPLRPLRDPEPKPRKCPFDHGMDAKTPQPAVPDPLPAEPLLLDLATSLCLSRIFSDTFRLVNFATFAVVPLKMLDHLKALLDSFLAKAVATNAHADVQQLAKTQLHLPELATELQVQTVMARASVLLKQCVHGDAVPALSELNALMIEARLLGDDMGLTRLRMVRYFEARAALFYMELFLGLLVLLQHEANSDRDAAQSLFPPLLMRCVDFNKFMQSSILQFSKGPSPAYALAATGEFVARVSHLAVALLIRMKPPKPTHSPAPGVPDGPFTPSFHFNMPPMPPSALLAMSARGSTPPIMAGANLPPTPECLTYLMGPVEVPVSVKEDVIREMDRTVQLLESVSSKEALQHRTKIWKFYMTFVRNSHKSGQLSYAGLDMEALGVRMMDKCPIMGHQTSAARNEAMCPFSKMPGRTPGDTKVGRCPVETKAGRGPSEAKVGRCPAGEAKVGRCPSEAKVGRCPMGGDLAPEKELGHEMYPVKMEDPKSRLLDDYGAAPPAMAGFAEDIDWENLLNFNFDLMGEDNLMSITDLSNPLVEKMFQ